MPDLPIPIADPLRDACRTALDTLERMGNARPELERDLRPTQETIKKALGIPVPERCYFCGDPATGKDSEGTPFCSHCFTDDEPDIDFEPPTCTVPGFGRMVI